MPTSGAPPGSEGASPSAPGHASPADPEDPLTSPRFDPPTQRTPQAGERAAPGAIIGGRYALRTAIGHGGMGTVWRAADTLLRRDVAVKEVLLPPGIAASDREQMFQRTLREAR